MIGNIFQNFDFVSFSLGVALILLITSFTKFLTFRISLWQADRRVVAVEQELNQLRELLQEKDEEIVGELNKHLEERKNGY